MSKVQPLKNKIVESRCCPNCGYGINQLEVALMRLDFHCPKCKKKNISDFVVCKTKESAKI